MKMQRYAHGRAVAFVPMDECAPALRSVSVSDERQEAARHDVDDAFARLHVARGSAPCRRSCGPLGHRRIRVHAVRRAHARALDVTRGPALSTPTIG